MELWEDARSWEGEESCEDVGQRIMRRCGTEDHGKMWDRGAWEDVGQRSMGRCGTEDHEKMWGR